MQPVSRLRGIRKRGSKLTNMPDNCSDASLTRLLNLVQRMIPPVFSVDACRRILTLSIERNEAYTGDS